MKIIFRIFCSMILVLFFSFGVIAQENKSYTISITIPKISKETSLQKENSPTTGLTKDKSKNQPIQVTTIFLEP